MSRELWAACLAQVFAQSCVACGGGTDAALCSPCRVLLERRAPPWCPRCGTPCLPDDPCSEDHRVLSGVQVFRAPFRYRGTGARIVHRFKFARDLAAGRFLVRHVIGAVRPWMREAGRRAVVVAVPRHRAKRRREGFDPGIWLARAVAEGLALPLASGALVRTRPTLAQADPRVTNRDANVASAFACHAAWAVASRTVLLVDDVLTSGATVRECAAALRAGGAAVVAVATAARA